MAARGNAAQLIAFKSMSDLRIIDHTPATHVTGRARAATFIRLLLIVLLAMVLRTAADRRALTAGSDPDERPLDAASVRSVAPRVHTVKPLAAGIQEVLDQDGNVIGLAAQTLPEARSVVGYRGPSNVLLLLNEEHTVTAAALLRSDDTPEHVAAVQRDQRFFTQFLGWTQGNPSTFTDVDATSGATLTALAVAEAIAVRLGSSKPSLRFPDPLNADDVTVVYGSDSRLSLRAVSDAESEVLDEDGQVVGMLIRTGPLVDSIAGYQGPSELLIATDTSGQVRELRLRRTFDNQPYAGYLNEEDYFWSVFRGKQFEELRQLDLAAEQVEGVSGATMTSMAVAETIVAAAEESYHRQQQAREQKHRSSIHWTAHDLGTVLVIIGAVLIGMTRLRANRRLQTAWLLVLVLYFGLITGNLISLAILMGWAVKGIAWRLAPGLLAVICISLILPPTSRRNLYCSHLCPHGAAQQLLRKIRWTRWRPNRRILNCLRFVPGAVLLAGTLVTLRGMTSNLAAWEPFDAWIWYVAGTASIILAVISLLASTVLPMAWCRYGCATGRLLEYLRHSARADRFRLADGILLTTTVLAWLFVL